MQLNDDHWICVTFKSQFIAFFEAKHINFYIWQACCSSGCHDWEKDCNSMVIIQLHRGHSLISMTLWHKVGHKVIVKVKVTEGYFSNKAETLPNNYFVEIPFSTLIGNIMTVQSTSKIHYNITKKYFFKRSNVGKYRDRLCSVRQCKHFKGSLAILGWLAAMDIWILLP